MTTIDNILVNNMGLKIGFDVAVLITTNNVEIFESAIMVDLDDPPPVGEKIYAVGSPKNLGSIVVEGIISKRNCWLADQQQFYDILSAPVAAGFSGGGVYRRSDGKYLGLISMKYTESGYGIMIPSNQILTFLESTKQRYIVDLAHEVPTLKEILGLK
jgi:S1-C subfamily serine protease